MGETRQRAAKRALPTATAAPPTRERTPSPRTPAPSVRRTRRRVGSNALADTCGGGDSEPESEDSTEQQQTQEQQQIDDGNDTVEQRSSETNTSSSSSAIDAGVRTPDADTFSVISGDASPHGSVFDFLALGHAGAHSYALSLSCLRHCACADTLLRFRPSAIQSLHTVAWAVQARTRSVAAASWQCALVAVAVLPLAIQHKCCSAEEAAQARAAAAAVGRRCRYQRQASRRRRESAGWRRYDGDHTRRRQRRRRVDRLCAAHASAQAAHFRREREGRDPAPHGHDEPCVLRDAALAMAALDAVQCDTVAAVARAAALAPPQRRL